MAAARSFPIVVSTAAADRLNAAATFLRSLPPHQPVNIVAASRGAADDLARRIAAERGATLGTSRFSLTQIAARVAVTRLAGRGIAPATLLGTEAVAARASFDAARAGGLTYLAAVADTPGFARALSRTMNDLRVAGLTATDVVGAAHVGPDLASLMARSATELDSAATADRATLLAVAAEALADDPLVRAPLLLLDVAIESAADAAFVAALTAAATAVMATAPAHDERAVAALCRAGGEVQRLVETGDDDLGSLRTHLFGDDTPPARALDGSLQFFSAPGEGRECVEIARRVLAEAGRGVRFDEMAILVRTPRHYQGLLEHALERGGIPAWFDRGTRRPHPAGRAFLALLACAAEGLSARRFAEYLSLGQLPSADREPSTWAASTDELFGAAVDAADDDVSENETWEGSDDHPDDAAPAGTLRAPRRWERMLVEAAVLGGQPERWTRRLDGLAAELTARRDEMQRQEAGSPRVAAIERELAQLQHLRHCALPLVEAMAAWPAAATWGEWLDGLEAFAPRVLRVPTYVLRVLADLRPMAAVGPVSLGEVRGVLADRLRLVDAEPPARRYGRVLVGNPAQVRGRAFRVVFVPGLAERMFPQKASEDPLLLDDARQRLSAALETRAARGRRERVLLHLAVGAATERLYVSYPRLDIAEGRARVPSFYALDILRGATGTIPDHGALADAAAAAGDATLAWPAPRDPAHAIDDQEHDLAVLRTLLDAADPDAVRGHAQYMLRLNPSLRRAVTERWARGERRWSHFDGLTRVTDTTRAAFDSHRLGHRSYSLSALQRYAACPYQFLLSAVYRLHLADQPQPLQRLDPLTRGSIVHRMQATLFRELRDRGALPLTPATLESGLVTLEQVVARVADAYHEQLAPAIARVWRDEIAAIARDLRGWLRRSADEGEAWTPKYFELAFGLDPDPERDSSSSSEAALIDGRFILRGSVDLVEEHRSSGALRVTDHKTGRDRTKDGLAIGGGQVLQPVLYSLAVEQLTGKTVDESRLFFSTSAGGYKIRPVVLTEQNRRSGIEALEVIDRAIALGSLAAAPAEGACRRCDFRAVCGPAEEQRLQRKPADRLRDLIELRSRP